MNILTRVSLNFNPGGMNQFDVVFQMGRSDESLIAEVAIEGLFFDVVILDVPVQVSLEHDPGTSGTSDPLSLGTVDGLQMLPHIFGGTERFGAFFAWKPFVHFDVVLQAQVVVVL